MNFSIIGCGKMGKALLKGMLDKGIFIPSKITVTTSSASSAESIYRELGVRKASSNVEAVDQADGILLGIKPQEMEKVVSEIGAVTKNALVISIAAGVTINKLETFLPGNRIVRAMPNTPVIIGQGISTYALGQGVRKEDIFLIERIFSSVGIAIPVEEHLMNAVTGLSGSGPAYVYTIIEALAEGGVKMGIPYAQALLLATHTVLGAAQLLLKSGQSPQDLRAQVMSKGGTTVEGVKKLEEHRVQAALIAAVEAATKRSAELGK